MTRQVLYIAHPVRPTEEEIRAQLPGSDVLPSTYQYNDDAKALAQRAALQANLGRAMRWLDWLRRSFPETAFIAPWIASILAGADDSDPAQREAGIRDNFAVIERCDGIVLCGGRISEGMRREMEHGQANSNVVMEYEGDPKAFRLYDLTPTRIDNLIRFPTWSVLSGPASFHDWYGAIA